MRKIDIINYELVKISNMIFLTNNYKCILFSKTYEAKLFQSLFGLTSLEEFIEENKNKKRFHELKLTYTFVQK